MKVAFAGTPEFAAEALASILHAGFEVPLVLTQPDRRSGRGMTLHPGPVKALAQEHAVPVHQPASLKGAEAQHTIRDADPDVIVVAAYGLILPQAVLDIPRLGCINIHASLLPRWRGAAPIQRALLAGDHQTGITVMQMDAGLDTGPMLLAERVSIDAGDTAQTLHDKLAALGADLIVAALRRLESGDLPATPQPAQGATYAAKIEKREAALDWSRAAAELQRAVRAFNPFPGASARLEDSEIKIWSARIVAAHGDPGTVLTVGTDGIVVACGEGALSVTELQRPGGRRLPVRDFLHGFTLKPGARFALMTA